VSDDQPAKDRPTKGQDPAAQPMIRLMGLEKRYPGQAAPVVAELDLDIPEGEIVILVGPSGCGKTTTLKMINRIIEPTAGRILLDGEDVTTAHADRLRRRIGYVIQQVGLFPHWTIADNVGLVPRMLGWDKARVERRVDELLELVGMEPGMYRKRYPKQLSGGQQQRIGVARALGADPPVMLMDEPFGAIDPITRDRLQNEFLRLQEKVKKTIVFVTHDIDEAIKLGDRIAILTESSLVAQYDTPAQILANPADEFVESFIGAGASVKRLSLTRVSDLEPRSWPTVGAGVDQRQVLEALAGTDKGFLLRLDDQRRPTGWLPRADVAAHRDILDAQMPLIERLPPTASLYDALNAILASSLTCAVVVDHSGAYRGVVDFELIQNLIHAEPSSASGERARSDAPGERVL